MANSIEIGINAAVTGQETVAQLTQRLDDMAVLLSGDLKVQAQAAADKLRELADQQAAIDAFTQLDGHVRKASSGLAAAEKEASDYAAQVAKMGPPTAAQAQALQKLEAAAAQTKGELAKQKDALAGAASKLADYGVAAGSVTQAQARLAAQAQQVRDSVKGIAPAYDAAARAGGTAAQGLDGAHRKVSSGVQSISEQLALVQRAYLALSGGNALVGMATDALKTADSYNNLAARIKLSTGAGDAFEKSMEAVADISLRTHASLETTGTLFAKLNDAGKNAGLSSEAAMRQALALTESVNQAVQLSGASAQASEAAITQLVQGLQGGVLRGDEFNSVMEQSPRLAKALADGLGVTTGELRKMAEAGQLSADTVITALKAQSATLKAEFATLPPTVGRAMQDLSTAWTLYIGNADKATGATALTAKAIELLAQNLPKVAGYLIDAGQAAGAFAALRLAQTFTGLGVAAGASAVQVAANATALTATSAAATGAIANVGRFAALLGGLKVAALAIIVSNFQDIGKWIGEGIAKLQGYKDKSAELAEQEKRQAQQLEQNRLAREQEAAALKASELAMLGLSKAGAELVAKFDQMRQGGKAAGDAIADIGKDFDLSKVPGIRDAGTVLNALLQQGKITATEFEAAWAQALKGEDLAAFETKAKAAFAGAAGGAERLAQITDQTLREAVRRVGPEYELLAGKVSKASAAAINDTDAIIKGLDRLKAQGVDTAAALTASLGKGIDTANTVKALDAVKLQIEAVRKVLGDKVADGLLKQAADAADVLKKKIEDAKPGIQSVQEAMRVLGVTSDADLKKVAASFKEAYDKMKESGTSSAREMKEAWAKTAQATIDANKGIAPLWVQAQAAANGYKLVLDELGKTTLVNLKSATDGNTQSVNDLAAAHAAGAQAAREWAQAQSTAGAAARAAKLTDAELEADLSGDKYGNRPGGLPARNAALSEDYRRRKAKGQDAEGFSVDPKTGKRYEATGTSTADMLLKLQAMGYDTSDAAAQRAAEAVAKRVTDALNSYTGVGFSGQGLAQTPEQLLQEAMSSFKVNTGRGTTSGSPAPAPPVPGGAAKTYDVRIGGRTIKTVSDADAQALIAAFRDAQRAA